jgi:hypothetical protein
LASKNLLNFKGKFVLNFVSISEPIAMNTKKGKHKIGIKNLLNCTVPIAKHIDESVLRIPPPSHSGVLLIIA